MRNQVNIPLSLPRPCAYLALLLCRRVREQRDGGSRAKTFLPGRHCDEDIASAGLCSLWYPPRLAQKYPPPHPSLPPPDCWSGPRSRPPLWDKEGKRRDCVRWSRRNGGQLPPVSPSNNTEIIAEDHPFPSTVHLCVLFILPVWFVFLVHTLMTHYHCFLTGGWGGCAGRDESIKVLLLFAVTFAFFKFSYSYFYLTFLFKNKILKKKMTING